MSWKPEVKTINDDEKFYSNALRFATREEAQASAEELRQRWLLVTEVRATECEDPVTHRWVDGKLEVIR